MPVDQVTRVLYRATLRAACKLDTRPALQALIHRNRGRKLPDDFNSVLSVYLGGHHRQFYIPSLLPGPTVTQTVKDAFRFPPGPPNLDAGLMGMRFMHGICQIAERHGLLPDTNWHCNREPSPREVTIQAANSRSGPQVRLQAVPEQGCILVSHPLLRDAYSSYFHQTVVLLCRHSLASGTYGLILNRFLSADAKAKVDRMIQGPTTQHPASSSGLDLARDMPAALQAMLGDLLRKQGPAAAAAVAVDTANESSDKDDDDDVSYLLEDLTETSIDVSFTSSAPVSEADQPPSDQGTTEQPASSSNSLSGPPAPGKDQTRESMLWQTTMKRPSSAQADDESAATTTADPQDIADPKHPLRFHRFITNMKRSLPFPPLADPQGDPEPVPFPEADPAVVLSSKQEQPPPALLNQTLPDQSPVDQRSTGGVTPTKHPLTSSIDSAASAASGSASSGQTKADASPPTHSGTGSSDTSSSTSQSTGPRVGSESGTFQSLCRDLADVVRPDNMSRTLSLGGPVPGGQVLHSSPELGGDAVQEPFEGTPGVYVGCDQGQAREVLFRGKPLNMRVFVGEAQWGSQQLESELAQGSWLLLSPDPQLLHDMSLKPHSFIDKVCMSPIADQGLSGQQLSLTHGHEGSHECLQKKFTNRRWHQIKQEAAEGSLFADLVSSDCFAEAVSDHDQKVMSAVNRDKLREKLWQETLARAGKSFADLINIPTQLVKELMDLEY